MRFTKQRVKTLLGKDAVEERLRAVVHGLQTSFCIIRNTEYARGNTTIVVADLLRRWRNCSTSTSQLKVPRLLFTSHDQDSSSTSAHASCELCDGLSDFQTSHSLV